MTKEGLNSESVPGFAPADEGLLFRQKAHPEPSRRNLVVGERNPRKGWK